jgi:hypothetical protein
MVGSMGESYVPGMDVERTEYPGDPTSATVRCNRVMKAAGQASTDPTTVWTEQMTCDQFYFLRAAVNAVGVLGSGALRTGFERLGSTEKSGITWGTFFSRTEHTSATVLRDLEFRTDIGRFAYVNKINYS